MRTPRMPTRITSSVPPTACSHRTRRPSRAGSSERSVPAAAPIERVLELDPRRKDAGLIVGTYRYAVSALPAPLRIAAHLVGFGADRLRALRMVEEAANYPGDSQPNALFVLVLMYNREARYDDALRVIRRLQETFPRNRLLWLEAGSTALRAGRPIDALAMLEEGLSRYSSDARPRAFGEEARWKYVHGAVLVALHRAAQAER